MDWIIEFFKQLNNPKELITAGGLLIVLVIVFIENGVFFGFFLPGDTLLLSAGMLCSSGQFKVPVLVLIISVVFTAILGSLFGYFFGMKTGDQFIRKKESVFFKKKYLDAAEAFFNRYGGRALILGRFLPVIRTFAPIFAGIVKLNFREYIIYNIIGAVLWATSMIIAGYTLVKIFPKAEENIHYMILGIIVITWIPVVITYIKERRLQKQKLHSQKKNIVRDTIL
ncbi:MAG: VTT domain-containing protein [Cytophagaceae bacterium]|nr:VTT domain-containing protein [Cytophagaceae bacterium]MDW8457087.1 VTT domain-containing protein [Cytophagaceae bacterium]